MKYNILAVADLHWGVIDPVVQFERLEQIINFIKLSDNMLDMIVICGDYYDSKIPLNSNVAILSVQWINYLLTTCLEYNIKKVRVIKGTEEHDNNQLEIFRNLEDQDGFFKIFNINTHEETLPDLRCIYCPDENINSKEYKNIYLDNITKEIDIGFFHGSFDVILPDIVVEANEKNNTKSIIYEYSFWSKIINGPLISGHWHNGSNYKHLFYVGSFERWAFNEEEEKGFAIISYDTNTNEYMYRMIPNLLTPIYMTIYIDTNLYTSIEEYSGLISSVDKYIEIYGNSIKIRIFISITDDNHNNEEYINSLKNYYISNKQVKLTIKNRIKQDIKKKEKDARQSSSSKFDFIFNKNIKREEIIHEFIKRTKGIDIPIEDISIFTSKYIDKI